MNNETYCGACRESHKPESDCWWMAHRRRHPECKCQWCHVLAQKLSNQIRVY